ncbi:MAG: sugar transferase [Oscillospiraceae bacterium]
MFSKENYKRILKFLASLIIIAIFVFAFDTVWNDFYNKRMLDPFWHNGNILMFCLYGLEYILFTKNLGGFRVGYHKWTGLFGSQILGILGSNIVAFVVISLIGRGRLTVVPMLVLTIIEIAIALVWSIGFTKLFSEIYPPRKMVIIYGNVNAADLVKKMSNRTDKYKICKSISCNNDIEYIKNEILKYDAVIISDVPNGLRNKLLKYCLDKSIRTYLNPKISDIIIRGAEDFHLFDTPLLLNRNDGLSFDRVLIKRTFDIIFSLIAIIVLSPFMLITAIAIKCYDGGSVLYKQERLTLNGKSFYVYKFRSMISDAEKDGVARLASKNDDRITPVGKIIRKIRFDEMPQLFNILKGDMSFVGPRPERPELTEMYCETMPEFKYRLKVKAGLTGYAQVMGKYNTTPYDKLKLDLMYIEHQSVMLDLKIILMTIKTCFVPDATEGVSGDLPTVTHKQENEKMKN